MNFVKLSPSPLMKYKCQPKTSAPCRIEKLLIYVLLLLLLVLVLLVVVLMGVVLVVAGLTRATVRTVEE